MNIKELEDKIKLISDQIEEYEECRLVAILVQNGLQKPTHELFRCTVDMADKILENLHKELEDCKSELQSLQVYNANGGYPFGN